MLLKRLILRTAACFIVFPAEVAGTVSIDERGMTMMYGYDYRWWWWWIEVLCYEWRNWKIASQHFVRTIRAQYAYAAFSTVSDGLVFVAQLAQFIETRFNENEEEAMKPLRKLQKVMHLPPSLQGLSYERISPEQAEIVVCIDATFSINRHKSSQLGMVAMISDAKSDKIKIIHYLSSKSKRLYKSVLSAELFTLVYGWDVGFVIAHQLGESLDR